MTRSSVFGLSALRCAGLRRFGVWGVVVGSVIVAAACQGGSSDLANNVDHPEVSADQPERSGEQLFRRRCVSCHGGDARGSGASAPIGGAADLTDPGLHARLTDDDIREVVLNGRGQMARVVGLQGPELDRIIEYIRTLPETL